MQWPKFLLRTMLKILPKTSRKLFLGVQIIICILLSMQILSANPQQPQPYLLLEMIYPSELDVGIEGKLQAVLRNNGNETAMNITVSFDAPPNVFNITLGPEIFPEELSHSHNMSVFFKITALETGTFNVEPNVTYFDRKGQQYEVSGEHSFNIKVNPAPITPSEYSGIIILMIIFCVIGVAYVAMRKKLEHYFKSR
ncbi:MAG: hypothetical protein JSV85_01475 [Candidatus Bathyarchaeota archaeon]|nr:MAG: hypothetical protein JSV85_01475 [Candidatus Bathyarchaeota archaeon]